MKSGVALGGVVHRKRDMNVREVCGEHSSAFSAAMSTYFCADICRMSLLGASWLCTHCGEDLCTQCYEVMGSTVSWCIRNRNDRFQINYFQHKDTLAGPCPALPGTHSKLCFLPSSRFTALELSESLQAMDALPLLGASLHARTFYFKKADLEAAERNSNILRIPTSHLRVEEFRYAWVRRLPLVVTGINDKIQLPWSPEQLSADYGKQLCTVEDCEGAASSKQMSLASFIKLFNTAIHGDDDTIWKVKVHCPFYLASSSIANLLQKDWPPNAKLSESHPELFTDFALMLPVQEYTRRDGVFNLAAHFPINGKVIPDLGKQSLS